MTTFSFWENHPFANMPHWQRRIARGAGLVLRPVVIGLDQAGLYVYVQKRMNQLFTIRNMERERFGEYKVQSHDVFVCTYIKSGTNWMLQIAYQIAHLGQGEFDHIHDVVPWPDSEHLNTVPLTDEAALASSPVNLRIIKTHLNWARIPFSDAARYIGVIRDPKEVFVSSYYFVRDVALGPLMPSVETWLQTYLSDDFMFGSWADHVVPLWKNRYRDNVLVVTFGDMVSSSEAKLHQIAEFMDVDLSDRAFAEVKRKSHISYMRKHDRKFYPGPVMPWAKANGTLVRKGKSGVSDELLTADQQHRIDNYWKTRLQTLGSNLPYDDLFDST